MHVKTVIFTIHVLSQTIYETRSTFHLLHLHQSYPSSPTKRFTRLEWPSNRQKYSAYYQNNSFWQYANLDYCATSIQHNLIIKLLLIWHPSPFVSSTSLKCFACNSQKENNSHQWTHKIPSTLSLENSIPNTIVRATNNNDSIINGFINRLPLFNWSLNASNNLNKQHSVYILVHQLIPKDLTSIFKQFFNK